MSNLTRLDGKIAFVTGGSSGIGAAAVRSLAEAGATVVIAYHTNRERAELLRKELPQNDHSIVELSLTDIVSVQNVASEITRRYGRLDILVNSAGYTKLIPHHDLQSLSDELFEEILIANARGPYSVIRAVAPLLRASADAVVINVSSISAFTGSGSNIAYCASKAAVDTMTMSLARALGPSIRFLCISPGAVATDFVSGRDRASLENAAQSTPLQRVVEPEDVAWAILACATHLKLSTGVRIVVDGGRHL